MYPSPYKPIERSLYFRGFQILFGFILFALYPIFLAMKG